MKNIFKYILLFIIFMIIQIFIYPLTTDEVWNYGFCFNMYKGLIPYNDFNLVLPLFFPWLFSLGLYIYSGIITLYVENSLLLCLMFYLIDKIIPKYKYIILFIICFLPLIFFPSYNLLLLFLFILIIYLEKNNYNDYLIGFIIGLIILTKHSVGCFFIIPSIIFYYKNISKLIKRLIGLLVPCFIFLFYLIFNNNLYGFINYCILGLFSFGKHNSKISIYLFISLILLFINIILIIKNKNIKYLYLLCFYSINIPLFNFYHFIFYIISYIIIVLSDLKINSRINFNLILFISSIGIVIISLSYNNFDYKYPNNINYFNYRYFDKDYIKYTNTVSKVFNKYKNKDIIFLSNDGYYFKLVNNIRITKYDLLNYGNFGYNGDELIVKDIIKNKDKYVFVVNMKELDSDSQMNHELIKYVIDNGKYIDNIYKYKIYVLE